MDADGWRCVPMEADDACRWMPMDAAREDARERRKGVVIESSVLFEACGAWLVHERTAERRGDIRRRADGPLKSMEAKLTGGVAGERERLRRRSEKG